MSKKRPRRLRRSLRLRKQSLPASIDPRLYRSCRRMLLSRQRAEPVVQALTEAENAWPALGLTAMAVDSNRREQWLTANASIALALLSTKALSKVIRRPRPYFADCPPARHRADFQSFPSTHAATSFAAVVAVPPLLPAAPLLIVAIGTAVGRLLLGEHYPSDIIIGAALGVLIATAMRQHGLGRDGDAEAASTSPSHLSLSGSS